MTNGKSLLIGFLVGGAVSATVTLLNAPSSGKDLRNQVKKRGENAKTTWTDLKNEGVQLKDQITQTSKEGVSLIKDLSLDMKTSLETWKRTIEPHQKNIEKYLAQIEDSLKELEEKARK
ncbi:YtxH domain-containing protein [Aquibacillus sp. 3ASR75-11]|uniref:YtxH domain-containing protein n=1 Tax=Terrihalobacillus insolitus TaxID=2950438 RepID=A0A9X4APK0_9BACI|nr:YtxH domain-containing protein [Terrihalobacillus insolitus]MDC3413759.1 YtxH domain-containing protein [Terrihalobacillus insolitus]MDC3425620.1 YtxH domain-containing protein [Terrihalobacillus insolitus]